MDGGAWWAAVHRVAQSQTQLKLLSMHAYIGEEMAAHSGIFAWRIPGTEETVGLQSIGSKRVGHDWATDTWMYLKDEKGSVWFSQQKMMLITLAPISDRGDDEEAGKQQLL